MNYYCYMNLVENTMKALYLKNSQRGAFILSRYRAYSAYNLIYGYYREQNDHFYLV